jgi:hypothetical protein
MRFSATASAGTCERAVRIRPVVSVSLHGRRRRRRWLQGARLPFPRTLARFLRYFVLPMTPRGPKSRPNWIRSVLHSAALASIVLGVGLASLASARAEAPPGACRLQFQAERCWCPDDYLCKVLPSPPCWVCSCQPDCYREKPLPPPPSRPGQCCGDDYCRKSLPSRPCSAERSFLCVLRTCAGQQ